jgi:hypothetical protein
VTLLAPALMAAYAYLLAGDRPRPSPTMKIAAARSPAPLPLRRKPAQAVRESATVPDPACPGAAQSKRPVPPEVIALTALFVVAGLFLAVVAYLGGGVTR